MFLETDTWKRQASISVGVIGSIPAGSNLPVTGSFQVPYGYNGGLWKITIYVGNNSASVNFTIVGTKPDLTVGWVTYNANNGIYAGNSLLVRFTINQSEKDYTSGDFKVGIYLSPLSSQYGTSIFLSNVSMSLASGVPTGPLYNGGPDFYTIVNIPSSLSGDYWLVAWADSQENIGESNEDNNRNSIQINIKNNGNSTTTPPPTTTVVNTNNSVYISPNEITQASAGTTFSVTVMADTGNQYGNAVDLSLSFDTTGLDVISITPGTIFGNSPLVIKNIFDNNNGTLNFIASTSQVNQSLSSGSLITIQFQVKPQVTSGSYTIRISSVGLADKNGRDISVSYSSIATVSIVSSLLGDLNNDGKIDYRDLAIFASSYGTTQGQSGFNKAADLNNDGKIDYKDLAILGGNYGKTSS
jgi:hypothetical protein